MEIRVGTSGWGISRVVRDRFPEDGSLLQRYAARFSGVEITSSFYRPHRAATYARWAHSVPDDFRFSLKLPRVITHERRLAGAGDSLRAFLDASAELGGKRDVIVVQLAPKHTYEPNVAREFFAVLRALYPGRVACEPRHASWFGDDADALLRHYDVARIAADPAVVARAAQPGGSTSFRYWRLHGSPDVYRSRYDDARLQVLVAAIHGAATPAWCIFDNTTLGAATENALAVATAVYARAIVFR